MQDHTCHSLGRAVTLSDVAGNGTASCEEKNGRLTHCISNKVRIISGIIISRIMPW